MNLALQKRTKIVATISDNHCDVEFLRELYETGMNVVRINTAHQTPESSLQIVHNVRALSTKIGILVDTKGPEVRTTPMENGKGFEVQKGERIKVAGNPQLLSSKELLCLNYQGFVADVPQGANILIDDGELLFTVVEKTAQYLLCEAQNGGMVKGRKTVNVPNVSLHLPSISERDVEYIRWAVENRIDFVAHSFVRNAEDVLAVQKILDEHHSHIKIIAKIENNEGVENIDEILQHVYGIMVARGDLGVEIEAEKIPTIQKILIDKAHKYEKPVIIATQMLHTMIENPRPTRAEVTDVANAIYQRTDAIMLSGETAYGAYPTEAVRTMSKIAIEAERNTEPNLSAEENVLSNKIAIAIAKSAVDTAFNLNIKAIVTDTYTGKTPRYLASFRGKTPIFALCYNDHIVRELSLSYGVYSFPAQPLKNNNELSRYATRFVRNNNFVSNQDSIIIMAGNHSLLGATSYMEIGVVQDLLNETNPENYYK